MQHRSSQVMSEKSRQILAVLAVGLAGLAGSFAWRRIHPDLRARNRVERVIRWFLIAASSIAIFTTVGIVFSVLFEAIRFFQKVPVDRVPVWPELESANGDSC